MRRRRALRFRALLSTFADGMIAGNAYFHPFHNLFIGAAMTEADIDRTLETADGVVSEFPPSAKA